MPFLKGWEKKEQSQWGIVTNVENHCHFANLFIIGFYNTMCNLHICGSCLAFKDSSDI